MMEARLSAELDAVRTVRPAAEKFYAALSDDQKKALTAHEHGRGEWGNRGERGGRDGGDDGDRGRGHHRGGWEGRDGKGGPDAAPAAPAKP